MQDLKRAVEKNSKLILDAERYIWKHPETGFKEYKTNEYMKTEFEKLGYKLTMADGITGFYTFFDTGKKGPTVLVLGELDSIICPTHPESDPKTGAVHSCGHNAQCAALLGVAAALKEDRIKEKLCGKIMLCAVPAEELLEIEYRSELIKEGKIKYFGGKSEFLSRGYFDNVDIAFMVHTTVGENFFVLDGSVGCMAKKITYKGKAAHAGGSPNKGINAMYAATLGLNSANALRETFKEEDIIRFHPIITSGGSMVNAIPDTATLESYVRGKSFDAMVFENKKINRALTGAALSMGANIDITDFPGYAPHINSTDMISLTKEAADLIVPEYNFEHKKIYSSGSTDMGDISCVMPCIHPYACGAVGSSHGSDYYIKDPVAACIGSAKMQMAMLYLLLKDGGKRANEIKSNFKPRFTIKEYLDYTQKMFSSGDRIEYTDDGAKIKL